MIAGATKVKLHLRGFAQLRNSPGVVADLEERAGRIAAAAGDGFATRPPETSTNIRGRARVAVVTDDFTGMYRQATDGVLIAAVDAGR